MTTRVAFRSALRDAAVQMLKDYKDDAGISLNIYRARPATITAPHAFVDRIREAVEHAGISRRKRDPVIDIVVVHGDFDSGDAADQADAFVDGFVDWITDHPHAAHPNSLVGDMRIEDDPNWVPDWLPAEKQKQYFATTLSLEGLIWS